MSLTLDNKIELGTYDFTISSDEVLKHYLMFPGEFLEFIKKGLEVMSQIDNDIVKIELNNFKKFVEDL